LSAKLADFLLGQTLNSSSNNLAGYYHSVPPGQVHPRLYAAAQTSNLLRT